MKTIYKYVLQVKDWQTLSLPGGAAPIHVNTDPQGQLAVWCWVNPDPNHWVADRVFAVRGTGHPIQDGLEYLGTVKDGPFMWHIFEKEPT